MSEKVIFYSKCEKCGNIRGWIKRDDNLNEDMSDKEFHRIASSRKKQSL